MPAVLWRNDPLRFSMMDFPSRKNLPDKCVTLLAVKQFREGVTLCSPRLKAQPHDVPCAAEEPMVCRLVWGFFCQVVFWFVAGSLFGAERPFLVPSPAIRFAERAERCQGTEMLA